MLKKKLRFNQRLKRLRWTPLTACILILSILVPSILIMYLLPIFATQTATLGAGVVKSEGTIINLATVNSNMTLMGDIVADAFGNAGNGWLINGTLTPPSFAIGSPYNYSNTLQQTNITGIASIELNLNVSTTTMLDGVEVWGTTGVLENVSVPNTVSVELGYSTAGNTTVYAPRQPLAVVINSTYYAMNSSVATWYSASNTLEITGGSSTLILIIWADSSWSSHNVFIREEVFGEEFDSPGYYNLNVTLIYDTFRLTYMNDTNILVWGEPLILATVSNPSGTQYYRKFIPEAATEYMYIPDIQKYSITLFTIKAIDPSNTYKDATIEITIAGREVASGTLDASFQYDVYLIDGMVFTITLESGSGSTYMAGAINANPSRTLIEITVSGIPMTPQYEIKSQIVTWSAIWNSSDILVTYSDLNNDTTSLRVRIYEQNSTKFFNNVLDNTYLATSSLVLTYAGNTSRTYYVWLTVTHADFGSYSEIEVPTRAYLGVSLPSFPNGVLGLNNQLPFANNWMYLISLFVIVMVAMAFSPSTGNKGAIVVGVIGVFFVAIGALPGLVAYAIGGVAIAILAHFAKERYN